MKKRDEVDQIDWWRVLASKLGFNLGGEIGDGRGYGRAAGEAGEDDFVAVVDVEDDVAARRRLLGDHRRRGRRQHWSLAALGEGTARREPEGPAFLGLIF